MKKISIENGISLLIVTWNNQRYIEQLLQSLLNHSVFDHEILVHVNEGRDNTKKLLQINGVSHTISKENIGLCAAANICGSRAKRDWVMCLDDDMTVLPGWDTKLHEFHQLYDFNEKVWLNPTMIEPKGGSHSISSYYGSHPENYQEEKLISELSRYKGLLPLINSSHGPIVMPKKMWDEVGGYSVEFGLGIGSEDELAKKCWDYGCRNFVNVPKSLIYHFTSTSTNRIQRQKFAKIRDEKFLEMHGTNLSEWQNNVLKRGKKWKLQ